MSGRAQGSGRASTKHIDPPKVIEDLFALGHVMVPEASAALSS